MSILEISERIKKNLRDNKKLSLVIEYLLRINVMEQVLAILGIDNNTNVEEEFYHISPYGKILVIGASEVSKKHLLGVAKECGLRSDRFEFILDYSKVEKFNIRKTQYNSNYAAILVSAIPHSTTDNDGFASLLSAIQRTPGYPIVISLGQNELKLTKVLSNVL